MCENHEKSINLEIYLDKWFINFEKILIEEATKGKWVIINQVIHKIWKDVF